MLVTVSAFTLASALAVSAAHLNPMDIRTSHHKRSPAALERRLSSDSGEFSWYEAGLGACGGTNSGNDFIVALSVQSWDGGSHCNEQVTITANGKTTTATIVDECMGCPPNKLDMSKGLFQFFGSLDLGIMHGSWSSGSGGGGGSAPPAQDDSKKKQEEADAQKKKDDDAAAQKKKDDDAWAKKQEDEAAQKKKDDDAKKAADDAWAKSSSEAAAKTSSSSSAASSSSAPASSSADASPTAAPAAAAASPTAGAGEAVTQANNLILQWGGLALAGYQS